MNTDVRRTHRLIVGAGIGLIAVVGLSTVAVNVHRVVGARSAAAAGPPVALPDTSAPPPSQTPDSGPPPIAESAPATTAPDAALPAATGAAATASSSTSAAAPKAARQSAPAVARPSNSSEPITRSAPPASVGSSAVVSASKKIDTDQNVAMTPASSAGNLQSSVTDAGAAASVADARADATAAAPTVAAAAPAAQGSDEPPATVQARAAGADSATSDRMITDAVQSQLDADAAGQGGSLNVTTINGVVILKGTVPSADVVEHAKQVAQQVRGVKGVDATAVKLSSS